MRKPSRIKPTLKAVEALWKTMPQLRLGQLLWFIAKTDPFYLEDDKLIEEINLLLSHEKPEGIK